MGENSEGSALSTFLVQLGAAMNASGQPVDIVQERLRRVAESYGIPTVRVTAFPTYLMVTMGEGEPAVLELTTPLGTTPHLDRIARIDRLVIDATKHRVDPEDGLRRLEDIRTMPRRFGAVQTIIGSGVLSIGLCLVLRPTPADVAAAGVFGLLVGLVRLVSRDRQYQVLMPVLAAFLVSALCALAERTGLADPGLNAIVAALVVFLPGASLTTAILELSSGDIVAGASRFVSGVASLAFLAFGIVAGIQAVGAPAADVLRASGAQLGVWAPWLGVLVYATGVTVAYSAPRRSGPGLLLILYAAFVGQLLGNTLLGGLTGAVVGATVMTVTAFLVSRLPSAIPPHASFLPGFWLLVPGALGLIGLTEYVSGNVVSTDVVATIGAIFGVAIGVLCGTLLWGWALATGRAVETVGGRGWWRGRER